MKMANSRHRNEKPQTYRALALMWFLIGMAASASIPTSISFIQVFLRKMY